ncbi:hypothetical protein N0O92_16275 [Alkalihalobacillus sp. MEB130]|uniref:hypothetical protein n=1 Tax=Alkalihalobacillus sp. MEB130 TaxID=2976704 RepID=UPI0028DE8AB5|nr:hypothetical protein [Alkalihalobacillus sp. MEB130]MDT8861770.1 hypothetical protein [Alkalihalobacillus sp. MEB130]
MDKNRKEIIINEIQHWKATKLLPEHYCDFLLTLYTEGDQDVGKSNKKQTGLNQLWFTFLIVHVSFLLTILVIYFTDFLLVMQMAFVVILTAAIWIIASKSTNQLVSSYYFMLIALIFFLFSVEIAVLFFETSYSIPYLTIIHCIAWIIIGWRFSLRIFLLAGVLGLVFAIYILFS